MSDSGFIINTNFENNMLTAPTQKRWFSGQIKLCAFIKVFAWLTLNRFEIATFGYPQTVNSQFKKTLLINTIKLYYDFQRFHSDSFKL